MPNHLPPLLSAAAIAARLQEPNMDLIRRTWRILGAERANSLLTQTLEIEANGACRAWMGGACAPWAASISTWSRSRRRRKSAIASFDHGERPGVAPVPPCTWDNVREAIDSLTAPAEEARMKLTLVGRPSAIQTKGQAIIFQLKGKAPANLPKGLPPLPKGPPLTWTVVVGQRQWNRVKDLLAQHPDDRLVIDGYL